MSIILLDSVHLAALDGDLDALHDFARKIGMKREWFQDKNVRAPHYDLMTPRKRALAIRAGAVVISDRLMAKLMMSGRLAVGAPVTRLLDAAELAELSRASVARQGATRISRGLFDGE